MPLLRGRDLIQLRHGLGAQTQFQPANGCPQVMRVRWFEFLHRAFQLKSPSVAAGALALEARCLSGIWCLVFGTSPSPRLPHTHREALRLVAGREQMTLRVTVADTQRLPRATPKSSSTPGPGRRYLTARLMRSRVPQDPNLRALRRRLATLVQKERFQLKDAGRTATLYHLIERGQSAAYLRKVRAFSERHPGVKLTASGPFPPYAFAPGLSDEQA